MLRPNEIATIRAALQFWQEEICPHDVEVARPYLGSADVTPLTAAEVEQLRQRFAPSALRYLRLSPDGAIILGSEILAPSVAADEASESCLIATVVLPAD